MGRLLFPQSVFLCSLIPNDLFTLLYSEGGLFLETVFVPQLPAKN